MHTDIGENPSCSGLSYHAMPINFHRDEFSYLYDAIFIKSTYSAYIYVWQYLFYVWQYLLIFTLDGMGKGDILKTLRLCFSIRYTQDIYLSWYYLKFHPSFLIKTEIIWTKMGKKMSFYKLCGIKKRKKDFRYLNTCEWLICFGTLKKKIWEV